MMQRITMMLKGAANTARLITAQNHPTSDTRFAPFASARETATMTPKHPMLKKPSNFNVNICKCSKIIF